MINSAIPRFRVFVATGYCESKERFVGKGEMQTLICAFFELLLVVCSLNEIEDLKRGVRMV
jgi:hypothetical protein